eukprot:gb/GECG01005139.1/.p1 GENE.gb/GECG01005139.1/~~gb/GECG01005139.1/.p1  ORF type:complete len:138 (+),score=12.43 gb/GECG01005139.1/:1-414(+)
MGLQFLKSPIGGLKTSQFSISRVIHCHHLNVAVGFPLRTPFTRCETMNARRVIFCSPALKTVEEAFEDTERVGWMKCFARTRMEGEQTSSEHSPKFSVSIVLEATELQSWRGSTKSPLLRFLESPGTSSKSEAGDVL